MTTNVEVNPFNGVPEIPLVEPSNNPWQIVSDSLAVLAVRQALKLVITATDYDWNWDIARYTTWDSMPLDNLRLWLREAGFPDASLLGERFEREVYRDRAIYLGQRNRGAILEKFAESAGFDFEIIKWIPQTGQRRGFELCITPRPGDVVGTDWTDFVVSWVNWMFPTMSGEITLTVCSTVIVPMELPISPYAMIVRIVEAS